MESELFICENCNKSYKRKNYYTKHISKCISESKQDDLIITKKLAECKIETDIIKPILKWVGGKTQIIDKIISKFPKEIDTYYEIFLGGGSVLFALLSYMQNNIIKVNKIFAYDLNEPLIFMYKNIQKNHVELYEQIQEILLEFNACDDNSEKNKLNRKPKNIDDAKLCKENYYYWIRDKYNKLDSDNKKTIIGSAMFIFLNKTCFRGVFRIGPNGFNVPYGHYKNVEVINKEHLDKVNILIKDVDFICADFKISLGTLTNKIQMNKNDFIYLDPPYAPENKNSFVNYTKNGFDIEMHNELFNIIHKLDKKILLSNSDVELIHNNFPLEKYEIEVLLCKRFINSKNPENKTNEVLISKKI